MTQFLTQRSAAVSVVLVAAAALAAWWYISQEGAQKANTQTEALSSSVDALTATTSVSVPATADPLKSATPVINPIGKTNPFNNEYQNPFE